MGSLVSPGHYPNIVAVGAADVSGLEPISLAAALESLKRVTERYCFDATCPVCGQAVNAGDQHECRMTATAPACGI